MNRINHLALFTCLALVTGVAQAQQTVVFKQMPHVALGSAKLAVSPDGDFLRARNLGPDGDDGFRTLLPKHATSWSGSFIVNLGQGDTMSFNPISDGIAIAPLEVTDRGEGLSALVEFTSSRNPVYKLQILEAGDLVAVWKCVPGRECTGPDDRDPPTGGGPGGGIIIDFDPIPEPDIDEPTLFEDRFKQDNQGNCVHNLRMTDSTAIYVGGLHLGNGDEVVVVERARDRQGRYPYAGFEAMEVRTSAPQMVFVDEASR